MHFALLLICANQTFYSQDGYRKLCDEEEAQRQRILDFAAEHGVVRKVDVRRLLNVTWFVGQKRLDELIEQKRLVFDGKAYRLPKE